MLVRRADDADAARWNEYLSSHPKACVYHRFEWAKVFHRAYRCRTHYLVAERGRRVVGVAPIVELSSIPFGRIFSSMPFFGHGGMLAEDEATIERLAVEAVRLAKERGARYIELRHLEEHPLGWVQRRDKVNMVLELPPTYDEIFKRLKKKSRDKLKAQIRRPEKAGHVVRVGGQDLLHPFWLVYSENMRDLGSPCHPEKLFATILDVFGSAARTFVVFHGEERIPIAGGIVIGGEGTLEIPCASSLRAHNKTSPNMMLYGRVLRYACDEGYARFNFGRSTLGEGTYRFKRQWGAEPAPLTYHLWLPPGSPPPDLKTDNPKFALAIAAWKKLPVAIARLASPPLVKGIP